MNATVERKRLVLSRKPHERVTLFVGDERIDIETNLRSVLVFEASEAVRIVRTELLQPEGGEAA